MRCSRIDRHLDDYVDGLLAAPLAERVRAHLEGCEDCSTKAVAAQAATSSMATWGDLDPSPDCLDAILGRIDALPADQHAPVTIHESGAARPWLRRGAWASGLAAAALLVWVALPGGTDERTRTHGPHGGQPTVQVPTGGLSLVGGPGLSPLAPALSSPEPAVETRWRDELEPERVVRPVRLDPDEIEDGLRRRRIVVPPSERPAGWPLGDLR